MPRPVLKDPTQLNWDRASGAAASGRSLSTMASLSIAAREFGAAEGYLLELLAWCAFGQLDAQLAVRS